MVKICHVSDWHDCWGYLPKADVYVVTGDMLNNNPVVEHKFYTKNGLSYFDGFERTINHIEEERLQREWFDNEFKSKGKNLRHFLGSSDAPVVVVRGNHDFTDLGPMFGGDYFEINEDPTRTYKRCGLVFGGFRGINYIAGEWADEKTDEEMQWIIEDLPDGLDVVVSHVPPRGLLDEAFGCHYGSQPLTNYINKRLYDDSLHMPKLFCFGHVHSSYGKIEWLVEDGDTHDVVFSNASTNKMVIELEEQL